jgi:hypothetical protein
MAPVTADPPQTLGPAGEIEASRGPLPAGRLMAGRVLDVLLAFLLGAATFVVHDVPYMFSLPLWTDEAWVAISTKLPLTEVLKVTTSTPAGWTVLLRLVFAGGPERLRIVPLLFAAATVIVAYGYVRSLPWPSLLTSRLAAVLAGLAALLTPSALARDDLKQYTADAFVTIALLLLGARLESSWSRGRLAGLSILVVFGFLFSAVSAFVGAAVLGSFLLVALFRRDWARAREVALVGSAAGLLLGLIFLLLYKPGLSPGLNDYWAANYLPINKGWAPAWRFLLSGGRSIASFMGTGPLIVSVLLVIAGVVTLVRLQRVALAITVPALVLEMIVLGAAKQYPLFDLRTSHFLTTALVVTAAIGVGGLAALAARVNALLGLGVAVLTVVLFVADPGVRGSVRSHPVPSEDLRTPSRYVAAHQLPNDIIVVNMNSNWGFGYYWDKGTPEITPVKSNFNGFITVFPDQANLLVATDRSPAAIDAVMDGAGVAAAKAGPDARIWFIHQHTSAAEIQAYAHAAQAHGLSWHEVIPGSLALLTQPL